MSKFFLGMTLMVALTVAAMGQGGAEQKVEFYLDGKIGTEVVKKGTYTVTIPETPEGTITVKVGKKNVTAQVVKQTNQAAAEKDKMTYRDNGDGTRSVASITPRGRNFTLVLQETGSVASGK
ncbi:MAG: hypothetical protein SF339_10235 [Blastocatellia bacterium]|nr:hypothetical protein [Blastocatellia bacterium]